MHTYDLSKRRVTQTQHDKKQFSNVLGVRLCAQR